ncbi:hypothetical protein SEA_THYATIRA_48 [Mycobacterium phage Thyatira]|uniref:Uncharacterized protein n=1 Tax=Mycobacterium phage Thyatira TaxID=2283261 RepID=A0A345M975_9CAUD|nr:hypothetical protein I5G76_gp53 [Mycobacterium phage Thyatira]AXH67046.1 hypothetical protein SEA_THYATIRA_48 [Mycobacterium phage Thyatira]
MSTITEIRPAGVDDDAAKKRRERAAKKQRDARRALYVKTHVLADVLPSLPETATTQHVCDALGIKARTTLHNVLHRHGDEMFAAGWNPDDGTFTHQSVILLCLLLRATTSLKAAEVAEAVGARRRVIKFHSNKVPHVRNCQAVIKRANEYAERIRDEDPAELWHDLNQLDSYQLQATVVALAAMVPVEQPDLTKWLTNLAPSGRHEGGGAATGLAKLLPTEAEADGVPIGRAASIEANSAAVG